jgi:hypothetical protein
MKAHFLRLCRLTFVGFQNGVDRKMAGKCLFGSENEHFNKMREKLQKHQVICQFGTMNSQNPIATFSLDVSLLNENSNFESISKILCFQN